MGVGNGQMHPMRSAAFQYCRLFMFSATGHPFEQFAEMILRDPVTPVSHEEWPIGSFGRRDSRNRFGISSPQGSEPSPACCGAGSC